MSDISILHELPADVRQNVKSIRVVYQQLALNSDPLYGRVRYELKPRIDIEFFNPNEDKKELTFNYPVEAERPFT